MLPKVLANLALNAATTDLISLCLPSGLKVAALVSQKEGLNSNCCLGSEILFMLQLIAFYMNYVTEEIQKIFLGTEIQVFYQKATSTGKTTRIFLFTPYS